MYGITSSGKVSYIITYSGSQVPKWINFTDLIIISLYLLNLTILW
jgi:hypothetical protein